MSGWANEGYRMLPLRPMLPGFVADTILFAAGFLSLFVLFQQVQRYDRRLRGQCAICGYDLRGQPDAGCPECGWNRADCEA